MKSRNLKYIIGGVLVVLIIIVIFGSISSRNLTYYYTTTEVLERSQEFGSKIIRVMGLVETGSVTWIPQKTLLKFKISDESDKILDVEYQGAKPDMFKEGQGVVVEGTMTDAGFFSASTLMVKHSEEYKIKDDKTGKKDYYKSLKM